MSVRRRPAPRQRADERGDVTTTALIFPVLLFVILLSVQFALAYHAKSVVTAAAQDGARTAEAYGASRTDGQAVASRFVQANAAHLVDDVNVDVSENADTVTVKVTGHVASVVPGLHLAIEGRASGPLERFRAAGDR